MRISSISLIIAISSLSAGTSLHASTDCSKSIERFEGLVCSDPELRQLDVVLSKSYKDAVAKHAWVRGEQLIWSNQLRFCNDTHCIRSLYVQRIDRLKDIVGDHARLARSEPDVSPVEKEAPSQIAESDEIEPVERIEWPPDHVSATAPPASSLRDRFRKQEETKEEEIRRRRQNLKEIAGAFECLFPDRYGGLLKSHTYIWRNPNLLYSTYDSDGYYLREQQGLPDISFAMLEGDRYNVKVSKEAVQWSERTSMLFVEGDYLIDIQTREIFVDYGKDSSGKERIVKGRCNDITHRLMPSDETNRNRTSTAATTDSNLSIEVRKLFGKDVHVSDPRQCIFEEERNSFNRIRVFFRNLDLATVTYSEETSLEGLQLIKANGVAFVFVMRAKAKGGVVLVERVTEDGVKQLRELSVAVGARPGQNPFLVGFVKGYLGNFSGGVESIDEAKESLANLQRMCR